MPLLLTETDVRALLPMRDLITAMERALRAYSAGDTVQPVRTTLDIGQDRNIFAVMPASDETAHAMGAKLVTVFHHNHERGLPSHLATIVLFDHATGALRALVDGRFITEARTAAVSAVSTKHLAREDAVVLAILGSGVQAHSHLRALRHVRPLREVRVWSRREESRSAFAASMTKETGIPVVAMPDAARAVDGADIIVIATASATPVIESAWVADGAHICAVGACRANQREMPTALVTRGRVFVDSRAGAMKEAGDLLIPINEGAFRADQIAGELGDVLLARVPGRRNDADVTIFKSLGMAIEDIVAADLVVGRAEVRAVGQTFRIQ